MCRLDFSGRDWSARNTRRLASIPVRSVGYTKPRRIASSNWDLPIQAWDELMEHDVGAFSGLTWAELEERFPETLREFNETRNLDIVEGAETHDEITARAHHVVDRLIAEHDNTDRVLVFSHGGILTHVIARLLGTDRLWFLGIRNTAIFEFSIDVDSWHIGRPDTYQCQPMADQQVQ